jgi:hypothetical protein
MMNGPSSSATALEDRLLSGKENLGSRLCSEIRSGRDRHCAHPSVQEDPPLRTARSDLSILRQEDPLFESDVVEDDFVGCVLGEVIVVELDHPPMLSERLGDLLPEVSIAEEPG